MKKTILATAISVALMGLHGCGSDSSYSSNHTDVSQQQTASVAFSANIPQPQATAALIDENTAEIVVKLYSLEALTDGAHEYDRNNQDMGMIFGYRFDYIEEKFDEFNDITPDDLTPDMVNAFSDGIYDDLNELDFNNMQLSDFVDSPPTANLNQQDNTAEFNDLTPGLYVIVMTQKDADGTPLSKQKMVANLGEGNNAVIANMMNGTWTFTDAQSNPTPYTLGLLATDDPDYNRDWDPTTDEDVDFITAFANTGSAIEGFQLNKIHYLSNGANPYQPGEIDRYDGDIPVDANGDFVADPVKYIFEIGANESTENVKAFEEEDWDMGDTGNIMSVSKRLTGHFAQAYDHRLPENNQSLARPELIDLEMSFYATSEDAVVNQSGGLFIFTGDAGSGDDEYEPKEGLNHEEYSFSYTDDNGVIQTMTTVSAGNFMSILEVDEDQTSLEDLDGASVTNGTVISGVMIEYISGGAIETPSGIAVGDDDHLRPTAAEVAMAVAMNQLTPKAIAAEEHPLGAHCSDLVMGNISESAEYALIGDQWVAGTRNTTRYVDWNTQTQTYDVTGEDLNGNGSVDVFETGVVYNVNYYLDENQEPIGEDLDGDGTVEQYEAVAGTSYSVTSSITACFNEVTLTGSSLSYDRNDFITDDPREDGNGGGDAQGDSNANLIVQ